MSSWVRALLTKVNSDSSEAQPRASARVSRGQRAERGVDLVELPQAALDLAVEVVVELRAGDALGDQTDQLVHGLELVGEALDAAQAFVAVAQAALHDLAAALAERCGSGSGITRGRSLEPASRSESRHFWWLTASDTK